MKLRKMEEKDNVDKKTILLLLILIATVICICLVIKNQNFTVQTRYRKFRNK